MHSFLYSAEKCYKQDKIMHRESVDFVDIP